MSAILAVIAVLALLLAGLVRRKHERAIEPPPVIVKRYTHPGHAWVRQTADGDVLVGVDDFAQSLVGSIDGVKLPRLLGRLRQGKVGWTLRHGSREVPVLSPVSGRVMEKNEMVFLRPSLVNTAPYGDGWLLRVRPGRLESEMRNLLTGRPALQWLDAVRAELAGFFNGTPALMYQDGGVMLRGLADRCSDEEWDALVHKFFLGSQQTKPTEK